MNYLIDTQILIWALVSPEKLGNQVKAIIRDEQVFVSQISFLEISIKQTIGKLPELDIPMASLMMYVEQFGYTILPLKNDHIIRYQEIPLFQEHKDPFDRLILACSLSERMPIISADSNFSRYTPQIESR